MSKIFFKYHDRKPFLKRKRLIRQFIEFLFLNEKVGLLRVDYIFCTDQYLLELNKKFLNHHFYTDIITFNFSQSQSVRGEVYISSDRVKENSHQYKVKTQEEFLRIIIHGALHLCGYDDKAKKDIKKMKNKEDYYLQLFHVKQSTVT